MLHFMTIDRGEDGELRLGIRRAAQLKIWTKFASPWPAIEFSLTD